MTTGPRYNMGVARSVVIAVGLSRGYAGLGRFVAPREPAFEA